MSISTTDMHATARTVAEDLRAAAAELRATGLTGLSAEQADLVAGRLEARARELEATAPTDPSPRARAERRPTAAGDERLWRIR